MTAPVDHACPTCGAPAWHCCTTGTQPCRQPHPARCDNTRTCPRCHQPQHQHAGAWYHNDLNHAFDCITSWAVTGELPNGMAQELTAHIDASATLRRNLGGH